MTDKICEIKEKVGKLIAEKGHDLRPLSLQIGMNETYLFQFTKKKAPKRLNELARKKLANILDISEQELTDIDLSKSINKNKETAPPINVNFLEYLINKVEAWIEDQNIDCARKEKAKLIKLLYEEFHAEPEDKLEAKIIDFFQYYDMFRKAN